MLESLPTNALVPVAPEAQAVTVFTPALDRIAENIRARVRESLILTGADLIEAQRLCPPGKWTLWLQQEFGWSQQTAYNIINVAKALQTVGNADGISSLTIDVTAFYVLAKPDVPLEVRQEAIELAKSGAHVTKRAAENLVKRTSAQRRQDKQLDQKWKEDWAKADETKRVQHLEAEEMTDDTPEEPASAADPERAIAQTVDEMRRLSRHISRWESVTGFSSNIDHDELRECLNSLAEDTSLVLSNLEFDRDNVRASGTELLRAVIEKRPLTKERLDAIADGVGYTRPDEWESISLVTWPGVLAELREKLAPVIEGLKAEGAKKHHLASRENVAHLTDLLEHALADPNYEVPADPQLKKSSVAEQLVELVCPSVAEAIKADPEPSGDQPRPKRGRKRRGAGRPRKQTAPADNPVEGEPETVNNANDDVGRSEEAV
jgi:hypothetical protein